MSPLSLVSTVLSGPSSLVSDDPRALARLAPQLIALTCVAGALFGGVVGSFHGGWQVVLAALKLPLVLLLPAVIALPAVRALHATPDRIVSLPRAALGALVGAARTAALATATLPLLWLMLSISPPYSVAVLAMAGALTLAGVPGLLTVGRALAPAARPRTLASLMTVLITGLVIAQGGWLLRPFVVAPGAALTVLCPVEGDVLSGLMNRALGRELVVNGGAVDCAVVP